MVERYFSILSATVLCFCAISLQRLGDGAILHDFWEVYAGA